MSEQYDLIDAIQSFDEKALARNTDPATSHAAADMVQVSTLEGAVVDALAQHGPMIPKEIAFVTGLDLQSVTPRMRPLANKKIIKHYTSPYDGEPMKRKYGGEGADCHVWCLA